MWYSLLFTIGSSTSSIFAFTLRCIPYSFFHSSNKILCFIRNVLEFSHPSCQIIFPLFQSITIKHLRLCAIPFLLLLWILFPFLNIWFFQNIINIRNQLMCVIFESRKNFISFSEIKKATVGFDFQRGEIVEALFEFVLTLPHFFQGVGVEKFDQIFRSVYL